MSEWRKYNTDSLFTFPIVADGVSDFVTDYTPVSGDAKIWTDQLISTTLSAETVAFTSGGTAKIVRGNEINGASTGEQADVVAVVVTSGTWAGGTAAGFLFVKNATGAFGAENLNITAGQSNIATIAGDLDGTLQPVEIGNGQFAVALTAAEMSCEQGEIHIIDSATKAIEDQAIIFNTYGNASALHAVDLNDSVRAGLTALPTGVADGAGGLPISDAGGLDMDQIGTDTAAILVDTGTTIPATITTIDDFLDTEIAAILAAVDTEVAAILVDTNELQTDDVPALIAALNDLSQAQVTGGAYALATDTDGRVKGGMGGGVNG